MFCKYCGKETENEVCENCKNNTIEVEATKVESTNTTSSSNTTGKSKIVAGLLGIFLGAIGVHNFYLGFTGKAIGQLLLTLLSCGILSWASAIWGLIEGILILTGTMNTDADGNPLAD